MDWLADSVRQIWEERPDIIALLALGLIVFAYVVLDTWRCRQRHRRRARGPH